MLASQRKLRPEQSLVAGELSRRLSAARAFRANGLGVPRAPLTEELAANQGGAPHRRINRDLMVDLEGDVDLVVNRFETMDENGLWEARLGHLGVVVVEVYVRFGGLGWRVHAMASLSGIPNEHVHVNNDKIEAGPPEAVLDAYGCSKSDTRAAVLRTLNRSTTGVPP